LTHNADFDFKTYWKHSFACATLSRLIAGRLKTSEIETAFVAGLLHDVGKVALAMKIPGKYKKVSTLCSEGDITNLSAEETVLGITHAEVGNLLVEHWLLPSALATAIRLHHSPGADAHLTVLSRVVYLANIFCKMPPEELMKADDFSDTVHGVLQALDLGQNVFIDTLRGFSEMELDVPVL